MAYKNYGERKLAGRKAATDNFATMADAKAGVLEALKQGYKVKDAVELVGRSVAAYNVWRKNDKKFATLADIARGRARPVSQEIEKISFEDFCKEYLNQQMFTHQLQWIDLLEGREPRDLHPSMKYDKGEDNLILVNCPPNHAKTTSITTNYLTYRICMDPKVRVIIISKTGPQAKKFLRGVTDRLTSPVYEKLQLRFAPAGTFKTEHSVWRNDMVYVDTGAASGDDPLERDPTVQALGIGQQIYGSRADLVILDDCVDTENFAAFEKQIEWVQSMVLTRPGPHGKVLIIGTRVAAQDLYSEIRKPERYLDGQSPWTHFAQPALLQSAEEPKDWVTLWPRSDHPHQGSKDEPDEEGLYPRWNGKYLSGMRNRISPSTWSRNYQQEDVAEDAVFKPEEVIKCVNGVRKFGLLKKGAVGHRAQGMDNMYVIASMDPATSGDTAVSVLAVDRLDRKRYLLDLRVKTGASPEWIEDSIKEVTLLYKPSEWRIEKNAFQAYLTQNLNLRTWLASQGCAMQEHWTGRNKVDPDYGVASMSPLFKHRLIELPSNTQHEAIRTLIQQLISWAPDMKKRQKSDTVMALWFAELRAREVINEYQSGNAQHFRDNPFMSKRDLNSRKVIEVSKYTTTRPSTWS